MISYPFCLYAYKTKHKLTV